MYNTFDLLLQIGLIRLKLTVPMEEIIFISTTMLCLFNSLGTNLTPTTPQSQ